MLTAGISSVYKDLLVARAEHTRLLEEENGKRQPLQHAPKESDVLSISPKAQQLAARESLMADFNVQDMSYLDMKNMADTLRQNDVITDSEWLDMTFIPDFSMISQTDKPDLNQKQNFISLYEDRQQLSIALHAPQNQQEQDQHMLSLLRNLDAMHQSASKFRQSHLE